MIYRYGKLPKMISNPSVYTIDPDGRVRDMVISPRQSGECNFGMSMLLMQPRPVDPDGDRVCEPQFV